MRIVAPLALTLAACPDDKTRVLVTQPVGPEGGTIVIEGGVVLDIPAGAMSEVATIQVQRVDPELVPGIEPVAPVLRFLPEGLEFEQPITVSFTLEEGTSGVVWWSSADGGMEVRGFGSNGVAVATNTHFSDVTCGAPGCGLADEDHECHGCEGMEDGEPECVPCNDQDAETCATTCGPESDPASPTCQACDGVVACKPAAAKVDRCRMLCYCRAPAETLDAVLCPRDPQTNSSDCPAPPDLPSNDGYRFVHRGEDSDSCQGYSYQPLQIVRCGCNRTAAPHYPLCPVAMTNQSTTGNNWACISTLEWGTLTGDGRPAATEPRPGDDDLYRDVGLSAWVQAGATGTTCTGHWVDDTKSPAVPSGPVAGTLDCSVSTIDQADFRWRQFAGETNDCFDFTWPEGMTPTPMTDQEATECRLDTIDAQRLARARQQCSIPDRRTDAQERATGRAERQAKVPRSERTRNHTFALLDAHQDGDPATLAGISSGARGLRQPAGAGGCPDAYPVDEGWNDIGYTSGKGSDENPTTNVTASHAEGDALLQLAASRNRVPAPAGSPDIATGGATGGCADLITDRAPCAYSCAPEGIDRARVAAGLERLYVRSPAGCYRYNNDTPMRGERCPPDDRGCRRDQ